MSATDKHFPDQRLLQEIVNSFLSDEIPCYEVEVWNGIPTWQEAENDGKSDGSSTKHVGTGADPPPRISLHTISDSSSSFILKTSISSTLC